MNFMGSGFLCILYRTHVNSLPTPASSDIIAIENLTMYRRKKL